MADKKAREIITRFLALADERGEAVSYALQRLALCQLELRVGDWEAASRLLDEWAESAEGKLLITATYQRCRALLYTGDIFDAGEAYRLGLVDKVFPKADLAAETLKIARRMSRVSTDCLKWNKRAINQTFEIMGLRSAIQYGSEACAIMDATGSPEAEQFDSIRRSKGLGEAMKWRDAQFAQFE